MIKWNDVKALSYIYVYVYLLLQWGTYFKSSYYYLKCYRTTFVFYSILTCTNSLSDTINMQVYRYMQIICKYTGIYKCFELLQPRLEQTQRVVFPDTLSTIHFRYVLAAFFFLLKHICQFVPTCTTEINQLWQIDFEASTPIPIRM